MALQFVGNLVIISLVAVLNGWVLTKMWGWFIVPTFDVPMLGIVPAIGLSIIASYFTTDTSKSDSESDKYENELLKLLLDETFYPLVYLIISWVLSWFM